ELEMEGPIVWLGGVHSAQGLAGGHQQAVLDEEDLVAAGRLAVELLIVGADSRRAVAMFPAAKVLAVEEERVALFQLEILAGLGGTGCCRQGKAEHGRQKERQQRSHGWVLNQEIKGGELPVNGTRYRRPSTAPHKKGPKSGWDSLRCEPP